MAFTAVSRRQLLKGAIGFGGGIMAAAAVPILPGLLAGATRRDLSQLTRAMFEAQVGTTFEVARASIRLLEVNDIQSPAHARGEGFSLIFRGPAAGRFEQGIHPIQHPELGRFDMFVAAVGRRDLEQQMYESVFNRWRA